jgi:hypothetical protein
LESIGGPSLTKPQRSRFDEQSALEVGGKADHEQAYILVSTSIEKFLAWMMLPPVVMLSHQRGLFLE